jgi:hypothetical protein
MVGEPRAAAIRAESSFSCNCYCHCFTVRISGATKEPRFLLKSINGRGEGIDLSHVEDYIKKPQKIRESEDTGKYGQMEGKYRQDGL